MKDLTTARLHLRRLRDSDVPYLKRLLADPVVMKHAMSGKPRVDREAQEFINEHFSRSDDDDAGLGVLCLRARMKSSGLLAC
jgi:RimJ/RimL family protein N-acetyltransferase